MDWDDVRQCEVAPSESRDFEYRCAMKPLIVLLFALVACDKGTSNKRARCKAAFQKVIDFTTRDNSTLPALTEQCMKDDWSTEQLDCLIAAKTDGGREVHYRHIPEIEVEKPEPVVLPEGCRPQSGFSRELGLGIRLVVRCA